MLASTAKVPIQGAGRFILASLLILTLWIRAPLASGQTFPPVGEAPRSTVTLPGLKAPVGVYVDPTGIPHIYAGSTEDAYFALGYLHATDRLLQMELLRRRASGTLAEIFGKPLLEDDIFARQLGLRRTTQAVWEDPRLESQIKQEVIAYCAGVNARLREIAGRGLPEPFRSLGIAPTPWSPVDALVFPKYMGWDQSGTDTDVWMGMLVKKLGLATVEELFPLDRPYEIPTVPSDAAGATLRVPPETGEAAARAPLNAVRLTQHGATVAASTEGFNSPAGFEEAARELHRRFVAGRFGSPFALGSNNWVIDGTKSATGKPLLANDPHLGLSLPSIWYVAHLVAPGLDVMGVTFPGSPYVIIGHNDHIAWGFTNMQTDAVDYFIEKMDSQHPHQYLYKGAWRKTERRTEEVRVRGEEPIRLEIESTLHGPLVTTHGVRLALEWTGLAPTFDILALARLNTAKNFAGFKAALKDLRVPALNVVYADVDGNIAIAPHGALPIRKRGNGRWPVDGASGDYDWAGFIPDDQLPLAFNPPEHYLASANGRPAPVGYPFYLGWMWDPSYRTRRIHQLLRTHERITLEQMEAFQMDAHDSAAESFVPLLLAAYDRKPSGDEPVREAIEELRHWNFEAFPESSAPTIWSAWFKKFRDAVWEDDFDAAGVERWSGSWGFSGSNERQPELEVLEFLTRENPDSPWFDDKRTVEKETRDDILLRSFAAAIRELAQQRGADVGQWTWGRTNVLRLHSLANQPDLDRGGMPVRGDEFTLCPGDDGGPVTGGASWRMVVDLGNLGNSFGVYPGGQSESPSSPHYDDQVKPWAAGQYVPLYFYSSPQGFQAGQVEAIQVLEPVK
jgi:penicillin amidase